MVTTFKDTEKLKSNSILNDEVKVTNIVNKTEI